MSDIPKTAKAIVLTELGKPYELRNDHPVKQPAELKPGECLVKIEYSGICHSDLHIKNGDWAVKAQPPLVGGHEGIGTVVAIGEHSMDNGIKVGSKVGVKYMARICSKCEFCTQGLDSCCMTGLLSAHGYKLDGSFADYVVSYTDYITPIPDGLDLAAAAPLLCAGLTIYKALKNSKAKMGQWVAITGAGGGLGHLGIQYAVAMGLRVVAIDTGEDKKKLCMSLGAEKWIDFRESQDIITDIKNATGGPGPHAAVIAVGDTKPFNQALMYLRPNGVLVCVGIPGGNALLNAPLGLLVAKSLQIVGSTLGNRQDMAEALELAARGKIKVHYALKNWEDINEVMHDLEAGKVTGRVVIKM